MRRFCILLLFLMSCLQLTAQTDTLAEDTFAVWRKILSYKGMGILERYYPPGASIVRQTKEAKNSFSIGGYTFNVDVQGTFEQQFYRNDLYGLLDGISTGVHESCHGLDYLKAYAELEKKEKIRQKDVGLYQGIHISDDKFILIKMDKVISCSNLAATMPETFRVEGRYQVYIYPSSATAGTQVLGAYALLDEWNAYYHDLRTALALKDYVRNEEEQTALNWLVYFMNFYKNLNAYWEFKMYIAEYLRYTQQYAPGAYKSVVKSNEFKEAFTLIQRNYDSLFADMQKARTEIEAHLATLDLTIIETDEYMKIGDKQMTMMGKRIAAYKETLALPMYVAFLEKLKPE